MAGASSLLFDVSAFFLFSLEFYHIIAHTMIMCGLRTLPRKDLLRIRYYFLLDGLTVVCSSLLLTQRMQWLMVLHLMQHIYYFMTWNKSYLAKKIVDWSSLEYFNKPHAIEFDSTLGTLFDILVHMAMMSAIYPLLDVSRIVAALVVALLALFSILFNPKFAWSSPRNMPAWVRRRLSDKLSLEEDEEKLKASLMSNGEKKIH